MFSQKNHKKANSSSGDIILGFGQHEVIITLDETPCTVSMSITTPCDATPVCHGSINKIKVTILEVGFILHADIRTNSCCVEWECEV